MSYVQPVFRNRYDALQLCLFSSPPSSLSLSTFIRSFDRSFICPRFRLEAIGIRGRAIAVNDSLSVSERRVLPNSFTVRSVKLGPRLYRNMIEARNSRNDFGNIPTSKTVVPTLVSYLMRHCSAEFPSRDPNLVYFSSLIIHFIILRRGFGSISIISMGMLFPFRSFSRVLRRAPRDSLRNLDEIR